jgi:RNA polymerase sigma factor (sigma-70 family)
MSRMSELPVEQSVIAVSTDLPELDAIDQAPIQTSGVDGLRQYLSEARRAPLLTAEQEVVLGQQIQVGLQAKEQLAASDPNDPDNEKLMILITTGRQANHDLVTSNLRLVVRIANRYKTSRHQFMDLIQDGNEELFNTTKKFNPDLGNKFSTYATPRILAAIQKSARESRSTGLLVKDRTVRELDQINKARADLQQQLSREPTSEELRIAANLEPTRFGLMLGYAILMNVDSLDTPINEENADSDSAKAEQVPADQPEVIDIVMYRQLRQETKDILARLDEKEQEVLLLRHGFVGGESLTKSETGEALAISRYLVRKIEEQALSKLRTPAVLARLRDYQAQ